jgi:hypothetical protein
MACDILRRQSLQHCELVLTECVALLHSHTYTASVCCSCLLLAGVPTWVTAAANHSIPFRVTEANSVALGGLAGVSDTLVAALWLLDYSFELAVAGGIGVNWMISYCRPYSPIIDGCTTCDCGPSNNTRANSPYMGMLAFLTAVGAGGRVWKVRSGLVVISIQQHWMLLILEAGLHYCGMSFDWATVEYVIQVIEPSSCQCSCKLCTIVTGYVPVLVLNNTRTHQQTNTHLCLHILLPAGSAR